MNSNKKSNRIPLFYPENPDFEVEITDPGWSNDQLPVKEKMVKIYCNTYGCAKCYSNKATRFTENTILKINRFFCDVCGHKWKNSRYTLRDSPKEYNVSKIIIPSSNS